MHSITPGINSLDPSLGRAVNYFDHNATTPLAPELYSLIPTWLSAWGNASSIHQPGREPKRYLREARQSLARLLGCDPLELVFTSGGSEANNLALKGLFESLRGQSARHQYLISSVEHPSIRRAAEALVNRGARVQVIPVRARGGVDLQWLEDHITDETALISVMLANNETGQIFALPEIVELAHRRGVLVHTDAVQALGKLPLNLHELGVDMASISGHKFYALKGVGALYIRRGLNLESLIHGGGQERHRRGGTENILSICSLGEMAKRAGEIASRAQQVAQLREHFEARVIEEITGVKITAQGEPRLANTSSLVIAGVDGETLLMNLDMRGFAVSTGAACSSGSPEPSPVLLALGLSRQEAQSSLRVSLGWQNTKASVDAFVDVLVDVVRHLRSINRTENDLGVSDVSL